METGMQQHPVYFHQTPGRKSLLQFKIVIRTLNQHFWNDPQTLELESLNPSPVDLY